MVDRDDVASYTVQLLGFMVVAVGFLLRGNASFGETGNRIYAVMFFLLVLFLGVAMFSIAVYLFAHLSEILPRKSTTTALTAAVCAETLIVGLTVSLTVIRAYLNVNIWSFDNTSSIFAFIILFTPFSIVLIFFWPLFLGVWFFRLFRGEAIKRGMTFRELTGLWTTELIKRSWGRDSGEPASKQDNE